MLIDQIQINALQILATVEHVPQIIFKIHSGGVIVPLLHDRPDNLVIFVVRQRELLDPVQIILQLLIYKHQVIRRAGDAVADRFLLEHLVGNYRKRPHDKNNN
ncbi:hypothetical protein D3C77_446210 [compost metagenome]